jgi:hypothetical protein
MFVLIIWSYLFAPSHLRKRNGRRWRVVLKMMSSAGRRDKGVPPAVLRHVHSQVLLVSRCRSQAKTRRKDGRKEKKEKRIQGGYREGEPFPYVLDMCEGIIWHLAIWLGM